MVVKILFWLFKEYDATTAPAFQVLFRPHAPEHTESV